LRQNRNKFRREVPIMQNTTDALARELAEIRGGFETAADETALRRRAAELNLSALCLSGGGIRSAAFSLGVLQALASARLLGLFDYLSTVSGGGYIGAWLQALIRQRGSVTGAVDALCDVSSPASPVQSLRNYTSYLSPDSSLLSTDLWTDIVLYMRNVLLNQMVFLPILLAAVIAPVVLRTFIWAMQSQPWWQSLLLLGAGLSLAFATCWMALGLPNHRLRPGQDAVAADAARDAMSPGAIWWLICFPFLLWAYFAPATLSQIEPEWTQGIQLLGIPLSIPPVVVLIHAAAMWLGFGAASVRGMVSRNDPRPGLFWTNSGAWLAATLTSSGVVWAGVTLARMVPVHQQAEALAVLGPLWLAVSNGLNSTVFVGLRRDGSLFDMDREWLARVSALKLRITFMWAAFAFAAIAIPDLLLSWASGARPFWFTLLTPLASGPIAAWLGKQVSARADATAGTASTKWLTKPLVLNILSGLFIITLIAVLGYAMLSLFSWAQDLVGGWLDAHGYFKTSFIHRTDYLSLPPIEHVLWPRIALLAIHFMTALVFFGVILVIDRTVNVNRYSMHAIYRNRLTRAFLGSARQAARRPDAFTQFDPNDTLPLADLVQPRGQWRLFHVINMTLNLTSGGPAAWAERKAMAFTASSLACGAALLPRRNEASDQPVGVYVPTREYAGREGYSDPIAGMRGLTLATAMTVSGAAVSPNWGYHSSRMTAFLMTLFNVRLGAWLPNPAIVEAPNLSLGRPPHALHPLLGDLLGNANATSNAIYLSDGGHFENLGIYEMFRRRCRLILVVDAGQDGDCTFEDLGNALRKSAIDLQVEVSDFVTSRIRSRNAKQTDPPAVGFAVGRVRYPEDFEPCGRLIYLKPSILDLMPTDSLAYGNLHKGFPHDPTPDQWFTESQFESYRSLGAFQMQTLIGGMKLGSGLDGLFDAGFAAATAGSQTPSPKPGSANTPGATTCCQPRTGPAPATPA
jgi:hypothetical protein